MTTETKSRFIVMTSTAKMPNSCCGKYCRHAVVELEPGFDGTPAMISARANGVARIVETWERCHMGKNYPAGRCEASRALREAEEMAERLNAA